MSCCCFIITLCLIFSSSNNSFCFIMFFNNVISLLIVSFSFLNPMSISSFSFFNRPITFFKSFIFYSLSSTTFFFFFLSSSSSTSYRKVFTLLELCTSLNNLSSVCTFLCSALVFENILLNNESVYSVCRWRDFSVVDCCFKLCLISFSYIWMFDTSSLCINIIYLCCMSSDVFSNYFFKKILFLSFLSLLSCIIIIIRF